jgi:hypothetical protein
MSAREKTRAYFNLAMLLVIVISVVAVIATHKSTASPAPCNQSQVFNGHESVSQYQAACP